MGSKIMLLKNQSIVESRYMETPGQYIGIGAVITLYGDPHCWAQKIILFQNQSVVKSRYRETPGQYIGICAVIKHM